MIDPTLETTLDRLSRNEPADVVDVGGEGPLGPRLLAMGLVPGAGVRVVQVAPFGDPITVELDGWRVSLRKKDASRVRVRPAVEPAA